MKKIEVEIGQKDKQIEPMSALIERYQEMLGPCAESYVNKYRMPWFAFPCPVHEEHYLSVSYSGSWFCHAEDAVRVGGMNDDWTKLICHETSKASKNKRHGDHDFTHYTFYESDLEPKVWK